MTVVSQWTSHRQLTLPKETCPLIIVCTAGCSQARFSHYTSDGLLQHTFYDSFLNVFLIFSSTSSFSRHCMSTTYSSLCQEAAFPYAARKIGTRRLVRAWVARPSPAQIVRRNQESSSAPKMGSVGSPLQTQTSRLVSSIRLPVYCRAPPRCYRLVSSIASLLERTSHRFARYRVIRSPWYYRSVHRRSERTPCPGPKVINSKVIKNRLFRAGFESGDDLAVQSWVYVIVESDFDADLETRRPSAGVHPFRRAQSSSLNH